MALSRACSSGVVAGTILKPAADNRSSVRMVVAQPTTKAKRLVPPILLNRAATFCMVFVPLSLRRPKVYASGGVTLRSGHNSLFGAWTSMLVGRLYRGGLHLGQGVVKCDAIAAGRHQFTPPEKRPGR